MIENFLTLVAIARDVDSLEHNCHNVEPMVATDLRLNMRPST